MPRITHEPSGLIAIRALAELEQERQAQVRAAAAAEAESRERAELAAREAEAARAQNDAEAAERARRADDARRHDERMRAIELEAAIRATQAARLAHVQSELDRRVDAPRAGARLGMWTAASLGLLGLGLAFLLPAPELRIVDSEPLAITDDPVLREAREAVSRIRGELDELSADAAADRKALADALAARAARQAAPPPAVTRPRPGARPAAINNIIKKPVKPGGIKICDTDDPLAEDC